MTHIQREKTVTFTDIFNLHCVLGLAPQDALAYDAILSKIISYKPSSVANRPAF